MPGLAIDINIDLVKAAEDIVGAVGAAISDSNRSVVVEVDNQLPMRLTFESSDHDHGGFGDVLPKGAIEPMSPDVFGSRSSGFLTGTEGHVFYVFNGHKLFIHWDNPEVGGNSGDAHVEPPEPRFQVITIVGNGNNSHTRFVIADVSCPAGGGHHAQGFNFSLVHDTPGAPGQPDWRFCDKCAALFWGLASPTVCPAGGPHRAQGFNFSLVHDTPGAPGQPDWRFCDKCAALFFKG
jgi:hypothetical protein